MITEEHKRTLVEHLLDEVANGISGRDQAEIFDTSPSRVRFAGVLQPPQRAEAIQPGGKGIVAPPDTALGVDFKVTKQANVVRLKITPNWSYYYPVFPTYEQALAANSNLSTTSSANTETPKKEELPESGIESTESGEESKIDAEEPEQIAAAAQPGNVILPRVFRRHDLKMQPIVVELNNISENLTVGRPEVAGAISFAREQIAKDPRLWKHISKPLDAKRMLGDTSSLADENAYQQALAINGKKPVDLPP